MRLLFVCYGNTCRSPMAEGLAKMILGDKAQVESAGLAPVFEGAAPEAVTILRDLYNIDISDHRTRNIASLPLQKFNLILVLDTFVHDTILKLNPSLSEKMNLWPVEDPFGKDLADYKKAAEDIWDMILNHLIPLFNNGSQEGSGR